MSELKNVEQGFSFDAVAAGDRKLLGPEMRSQPAPGGDPEEKDGRTGNQIRRGESKPSPGVCRISADLRALALLLFEVVVTITSSLGELL